MTECIDQGEITRLTICCEWVTQDGPGSATSHSRNYGST